jgi:hypothetical protein
MRKLGSRLVVGFIWKYWLESAPQILEVKLAQDRDVWVVMTRVSPMRYGVALHAIQRAEYANNAEISGAIILSDSGVDACVGE